MAAGHVFHYRHGWIPLDHTDASSARGIRSRGDVARAVTTLPRVAPADRAGPKREIIHAAARTGSHDLLPSSWPKGTPRTLLAAEDVAGFKGGSAEAYLVTDADGSVHFTPERAALHQKIIDGMLAGHEAQAHPRYHLMGGGPASGKSTMMDAIAADTGNAAIVNADDVKAALPEYSQKGTRRLRGAQLRDTDDDPGLVTAWVIAVTSASIDEHGHRASLTEYRTSLDSDLATCRGLYEMGADHCRRILDD